MSADVEILKADEEGRGGMPFDLYCKFLLVVRVHGAVRCLEVVPKERAARHGTEDWQTFVSGWGS